jgi:hypothetical protein
MGLEWVNSQLNSPPTDDDNDDNDDNGGGGTYDDNHKMLWFTEYFFCKISASKNILVDKV